MECWWWQAPETGLCWVFIKFTQSPPIILYECGSWVPRVCPVWGFRGSRCPGDWLWPSLPLQYGMLLYQNYRIPQQRKAMLSHFSTPVVSQAAPLKPHSSSAAASARAVGIFSQMRLPPGARIAYQHAFPRRWTLSSQQCDCWEQIPLYPLPFPTSPCSIALVNGCHWELYSSVQKCWQRPRLLRSCLHHLRFCPFQLGGPWCCWPWCSSPSENWDCNESSCDLRMDFMSQRCRNSSSSPNMILTHY